MALDTIVSPSGPEVRETKQAKVEETGTQRTSLNYATLQDIRNLVTASGNLVLPELPIDFGCLTQEEFDCRAQKKTRDAGTKKDNAREPSQVVPREGSEQPPTESGERSVAAPRELSEQDRQRLDAMGTKYGVKTERKVDENGNETFNFYYVGAKDQRVDVGSAKSLEAAERMLDAEVRQRIDRIEQGYHVHISRDGEKGAYNDSQIDLRTPGIRELAAVEQALSRIEPAQFTKNQRQQLENGYPVETGKPLNIDFPKTEFNLEGYTQPVSYFVQDDDNARTILQNTGSYDGLYYTLVHEINHNEQHQMGVFGNVDEYARTYGMHRGETGWGPFTKKTNEWILDGKSEGEFYKRDWSPENAAKNVWIKTDYKGNPVTGPDGKPVIISNDAARERARITPPSAYFPNPIENGADAATKFRENADTRARFLQDSPTLYQSVKEQDQQQLDRFYGKNPDGSSKYVRLPDGRVAQNSEQNRATIASWETANRNRPVAPQDSPERGSHNCATCSTIIENANAA